MRHRKLDVQQLENRQMMAGDISFESGILSIKMSDNASTSLWVSSRNGYVTVSGNATLRASGAEKVSASTVREIRVIGTDAADSISLSGVNQDDFPSLHSTRVAAGGGNDNIIGSDVADVIFGGFGNDTIHGLGGNDRLYGDAGHDTIYGGHGVDIVRGGAGNDSLWGGAYRKDDDDSDFVFGGRGNDTYGFSNLGIGSKDFIKSIERDLRG